MLEIGNRLYFTDYENQYLYFYQESNGVVKGYYDEVKKNLDGIYSPRHQRILEDLTNHSGCDKVNFRKE